MSDIPEHDLDEQINALYLQLIAAQANLAELQKQLALTNPEPVPDAVPGAPAIATSSGQFAPGNATAKLANASEQLRKLLLDHGSFDKVEGVLEKWHIQKKNSAESGGKVTKHWLMEVRKFTQTMADNSFEWARRKAFSLETGFSSTRICHMCEQEQDIRIRTADCGFEATERYHIAGLTEGLLQTSDGVVRPARLHSSFKAYATMPPEVTAQDKKPVRFDLVVEMPYEEYMAGQESFDKELVRELSEAVFIPEDLVDILDVKEERPGAIEFTMSFSVEPRCLQELGPEVDLLSFGIDTKEGCNLVAPVEYMNELQTQLSNPDSALFYQTDLVMLNKVNADRSFGFSQQFFCSKEPFWQFAAVVLTESECPFDLVKLGGFALVGGTVAVTLVLAVVARLARECGGCIRLAKVRLFDVLTPLMGLYTTAGDYAWLIYLSGAESVLCPSRSISFGRAAKALEWIWFRIGYVCCYLAGTTQALPRAIHTGRGAPYLLVALTF
ncbi:hypothetical protein AK812_SmicGene29019 [Symbiodinium microadriaticum]|uniref:Uncharacterized protein n=1 Tax=Symbiodinium microadriaticum TaxID=2951 RepID=A0A1Q9D2Y7_SYMMI|nr:hypothetical protein AK812_SmicGene29019 [Symbiodinium microadriaticum]